jgi:hypothetical protein
MIGAPAITQAQIDRYRGDGYCVVPRYLVPADVETLSRLAAEAVRVAQAGDAPHVAHFSNVLTPDPKGHGTDVIFVHDLEGLGPTSRWVPALRDLAVRLIGTDRLKQWPDFAPYGKRVQINRKRPCELGGERFEWHQDGFERDAIVALLALQPATIRNGCIRLIPSSQPNGRTHISNAVLRAAQRRRSPCEVFMERILTGRSVPLVLNPGDVAFMNGKSVHCSPVNPSEIGGMRLKISWERTV